jgi:hypothetical protein
MGLLFNGFRLNSLNRENMRFWPTLFIEFVSAFYHIAWRTYHSTAKSLIFPNMKLSDKLHNSDIIARWSSIPFFYTVHHVEEQTVNVSNQCTCVWHKCLSG